MTFHGKNDDNNINIDNRPAKECNIHKIVLVEIVGVSFKDMKI